MKNIVAKHVAAVPPSGIRRFFDISSEMKDAISLGVGEPDFITPWNIRESAIYSIEKGKTHYTSNHGMKELRSAICEYLKVRFELNYSVEQTMITVGASEALDLAFRAIIDPGDEILVPAPSYVAYMPGVAFAGGVPVGMTCVEEDEFRLTPEAIENAITNKTKAIVIPFPNNPTGAVMRREHLEAISKVILKHDLFVISDEIYAELTYGEEHVSIASLPGMSERTLLINGFSKAFAMTGWRLGYACGPQEIVDAMVKIHQYSILCAPIMSQMAGLEAITSEMNSNFEQVKYMRRSYDQRRNLIYDGFRDLGLKCYEPKGAFYLFPNITGTGLTSEEFCQQLLMKKKVACVPGTAFGESGEGFCRCSYASSVDNITQALRRIKEFVSECASR